jgi:hypothetical protein
VDYTVLNFGIRVDAFDSLREALQAVHTGDQDILDPSVMQIGQNAQPMVSAFLVGEIEAQELFLALDIEP